MNVLLIGSGGREHTLAWKMVQSEQLTKLYTSPGNPGTAQVGTNVTLDANDHQAIIEFVDEKGIDLVVIGPEAPLVEGLHDSIANSPKVNPIVIGPKKVGAQLEGSKKFAKEFMAEFDIPTARYKTFNKANFNEANDFLDTLNPPYVLKADGLAAGKGVVILPTINEAMKVLDNMINQLQFGEASKEVVIEEYLDGIELSVFAIINNGDYAMLPTAKDYKRIGEGDTGLNTGGMGAISPAPSASQDFLHKVEHNILKPTVDGLVKKGIDYQGFIFIGLMDVAGKPYVIEYNVRMGDPETEAVLPRVKNDLLDLLATKFKSGLSETKIEIDDRSACTVMTVSGGYPEQYNKGYTISGIDDVKNAQVFQAGTLQKGNDIVTNGGRVLAITAMDSNILNALETAYSEMKKISYKDQYYRNDIGYEVR